MMRAAVRLLCWVVVGLVAASVAGCGTAESRRARALERGQQYLDTGKLDKARVEFQKERSGKRGVIRLKEGIKPRKSDKSSTSRRLS